MKKHLLVLTLLALFTLQTQFSLAQEIPDNSSKLASVMINVTTSQIGGAGRITLDWLPEESSTRYEVYRRDVGSNYWGTIRESMEGDATSYSDEDVEIGKAYEYKVFRYYNAMGNYGGVKELRFIGAGYVCAGIDIEPIHDQGRVLLLVDKTLHEAIEGNLNILIEDLILDGWTVEMKLAERAETFDKDKVQAVKQQIMESAAISSSQLKAVMLIGRIPVPYSGFIYPDGHNNHVGAWPADAYYGSLTESYWTDVNDFSYPDGTKANRDAQVNVAGDGKFDQSQLSVYVDLYVGRIDFYNMPLFEKSEVDLLNQYLEKNHNYRSGEMKPEKRALIDENFSPKSYMETFGASAYRNFASLLGNESITKADWFTTLSTDSYLWAYGNGGGSFTSCGGVGKTQDYVENDINAVYTLTFGSYFGDWDVANNFLRAPLCTSPSSLISAWVARPPWYFHHMSLGYPIGYSTRLSQVNGNDYLSVAVNLQGSNYSIYAAGINSIHASLLGDPTLRMDMTTVSPPSNLALVLADGAVKVSWEVPPTDEPIWTNVYRASSENGPFAKMNEEPLQGTEFIDDEELEGMYYYMVRSEQPLQNNSGVVNMLSRGITAGIDIPVGVEDSYDDDLVIYPNPAVNNTTFKISVAIESDLQISISDVSGRILKAIYKTNLSAGQHTISWDIRDSNQNRLPPGIYLVRAKLNTKTISKKIIVN